MTTFIGRIFRTVPRQSGSYQSRRFKSCPRTWLGWSFEIVDMDGNRTDKVLGTRARVDGGATGPGQ